MKCILLGLDGASYHLIESLAGDLPNLDRIRENGAHGKLTSTILPNSFPAWPVISTGRNPGKLGVFDFMRETPDHRFLSNNAVDIKAEFLWEMLGENGLKCGLINVPGSSPFRSDIAFGEGDFRYKDWVDFSWADTTIGVMITSASFEKRVEELVVERFAQIAWAFENREWDFLMMNINAVDVMSHHRWDDHEFIRRMFILVDRKLGELMDSHPEIDLFVISDHGMVETERRFWTMNWLENEGLLFRGQDDGGTVPLLTRRRAEGFINSVLWFAEKLGLRKLAVRVGRGLGRKLLKKGSYDEDIGFTEFLPTLDWERTLAYSHGHQGKIYLNREHPDVKADRELVRSSVVRRLEEFCRNNAIELEVFTNRDVYRGPHSDDGEDLMFIMDDGRVLPQTHYRRDGQVLTHEGRKNYMSAHHHRTGILFATGPHVAHTTVEGASVFDITPTILALFGFRPPSGMDGVPLEMLRSVPPARNLGRREGIVDRIQF